MDSFCPRSAEYASWDALSVIQRHNQRELSEPRLGPPSRHGSRARYDLSHPRDVGFGIEPHGRCFITVDASAFEPFKDSVDVSRSEFFVPDITDTDTAFEEFFEFFLWRIFGRFDCSGGEHLRSIVCKGLIDIDLDPLSQIFPVALCCAFVLGFVGDHIECVAGGLASVAVEQLISSSDGKWWSFVFACPFRIAQRAGPSFASHFCSQ